MIHGTDNCSTTEPTVDLSAPAQVSKPQIRRSIIEELHRACANKLPPPPRRMFGMEMLSGPEHQPQSPLRSQGIRGGSMIDMHPVVCTTDVYPFRHTNIHE
ncbi:hypothetical protein WJX75_002480 [Coccomyxa subellipsoidea]|uniref:Uncharacterized protein n=1 Tax=Coccomyxa subellipsoidea TaxID=248742 RepID=A0ABR2YEQ0_9CHLO